MLHTVGPKYSEKYQVAAENALYSCYRDCLGLCVEEKLRSVAIPCIYTRRKKYPRDAAAHVALRTVRRFVEKHSEAFDAIVLCVDEPEDFCLYEAALPLYFPRTMEQVRSYAEDLAGAGSRRGRITSANADVLQRLTQPTILQRGQELEAEKKLPKEIGNEHGERVIEERKIKIAETVLASPGDGAAAVGGAGSDSRSSSTVRRSVDRAVGGSDYRSLRANPDDLRRRSSQGRTASEETDYRSEGMLYRILVFVRRTLRGGSHHTFHSLCRNRQVVPRLPIPCRVSIVGDRDR